ncbi:AT-rich interactive domain-containing protein 5B-like [Arapaima gigas]
MRGGGNSDGAQRDPGPGTPTPRTSRLYFLPEDTPKGRMSEHGEDEVLAVSKKIVIRIEDLVKWTCSEPTDWKGRRRGVQHLSTPTSGNPETVDEKDNGMWNEDRWRVKVLSYPQYCRFRSLQRRLQDRISYSALQDPHLLALGGMRVAPHNTWVLYCRDTFNHPTLDSNTSVWTHLGCTSLSLKGRPRKRRSRDGKVLDSQNHNQSVASWIERMKESVMGSVELPCEGSWLPHPEEQHFLNQLYVFMERRGSPISKVPNLGFKKIDLFLLFSTVKKLGGYERVTSERLWKQVYNKLGGSPGSTSAATCTRRHYEKLMLAYEKHLKGGGSAGSTGSARGGGGEHSHTQELMASGKSSEPQKGREAQVPQKKKFNGIMYPVQDSITKLKATKVRRRGRPPSKRHTRPTAKTLSQKLSRGSSQDVQTPDLCRKSFHPLSAPSPQDLSSIKDPLSSGQVLGSKQAVSPPNPSFHSRTERAVVVPCEEPVNLCPSGPLGAFSLPKVLCPLSVFRARLGLSNEESANMATHDTGALQPSILIVQPKPGTPEQLGPSQGSLSGTESRPQRGTPEARARCAVLPPLRIIPLDIDCSVQVRQFMKSRVGPAELSSFTRRLSEVLAQDLSKACHPSEPQGDTQEQSLPLNLSKRATSKRRGEDAEAGGHDSFLSKRTKVDHGSSGGSRQLLKLRTDSTHFHEVQEEPADLSSPMRARAADQNRASRLVTGSESIAESSLLGSELLLPSRGEGGGVSEGVHGLLKQTKAEDVPSGSQHPVDNKGGDNVAGHPNSSSSDLPSCYNSQPGSLQAPHRRPLPNEGDSDMCRDTGLHGTADVCMSTEKRSIMSTCVSATSLTLPLAETK